MKMGRVEIYSKDGDILKIFNYRSMVERNTRLKKAGRIYGERFQSCYYHIIPNIWGRVDLNGRNMPIQAPRGDTPSSLRELMTL